MSHDFPEGHDFTDIETLAGLYDCVRELIAERDRLQAVVDVEDDFWPLIESIYDEALGTWEYSDPRLKYVTVQIDKVDLPTLYAAYAPRDSSDD